jgi:hypothetical protein
MSRALLTVVLVGCFAAATPAWATVSVQDRTRPADTVSDSALRRPPQGASEALIVVTADLLPERSGAATKSANSRSGKEDVGWRTYGTLLATLVLMAAIALRRHRAGGS